MDFSSLIVSRRSTRSYLPDCSIPSDILDEILKDARLAPSWKNTQTARCYIALSKEKKESVKAGLPAFNQNSTANAAAYLVTTYVKDIAGFSDGIAVNEAGNEWGAYDLGLFTSYLLLSAKAHGYDSLIMGIRDSEPLRRVFEIPEQEQVLAVVALGIQDGTPVFKSRNNVRDYSVIL